MILIRDNQFLCCVIIRNELKYCPSDKVLNPLTKRCVSKTGSIGKKILNKNKKCPDDKVLNSAY